MYQRDYILRLIEQLIRALAVFTGLLKKGDLHKAGAYLDNLYYDLLKQEAAFFRNLSLEDMTEELLGKHNYTNDHLEIIAELFSAEAELSLAKGDRENCLAWSDKSLRLFRFIDRAMRVYSQQRIDKMAAIEDRINSLS